MNNIGSESPFVKRVGGKTEDMVDRLVGKERKRFLYRQLEKLSMEEEAFIDDLKTMRYLAERRTQDDDHVKILEKKSEEHERNLLRLIREGLGERIIYNERLMETVRETIVPYYHGRFQMGLSREISFLPLTLRLLVYGRLLEEEAEPVVRYHLYDRIAMTLYKIGDERVGEYALFLQCMLGSRLSSVLFKKERDFSSLFAYQLKGNRQIRGLREDILTKASLTPEIAGREFWYGFRGFSELKNINDVDAARICLRLFTLYFEKNFSIANTVETQLLKYYTTKNANVIKKLLRDEGLDELRISSRYTEGVLGAADGPEELDDEGRARYEEDMRRRVTTVTALYESRLKMNGARPGFDDSLVVIPLVLDKQSIGMPLKNLATIMEKHAYTLPQIDSFIGRLVKSMLSSKDWEPSKYQIFLGTMKAVRSKTWRGEEKEVVRILRVLKSIMEDTETIEEDRPACLLINIAIESPQDYTIIADTTEGQNLFEGVGFVSSPVKLRHALRDQEQIIEHKFIRPLRIMAPDWTKTSRSIGLSEKEIKLLNTILENIRIDKT